MKQSRHSDPENEKNPSRRHFMFAVGTISVTAGIMGFLATTFRYLFPNVLYEPPTRFPIGRPDEFPPGTPTFMPEQRLFIFNSQTGYYAISSVCTHLGCNVNYVAGQGFACPCHGSRFDKNGLVVKGPAPRPLSWFGLSMSPRGELVVDERRTVKPDYRFKV
jgi:cytochrome b6-f complex iron-sulfur subunit